jgi:hypothetical protein
MKLEVGKRYRRVDGEITQPLQKWNNKTYPFEDPRSECTYTSDGCRFSSGKYDEFDLVEEYTEPTDNEVTHFEPIPGKYYRTEDGSKVFYVGKDKYNFDVYQKSLGEYLKYTDGTTCCKTSDLNIASEWVDEVILPAVEIKRWAIVRTTPYKGLWRGYVRSVGDNKKTLESDKQEDEEIVELTGTLQERKVKCQ